MQVQIPITQTQAVRSLQQQMPIQQVQAPVFRPPQQPFQPQIPIQQSSYIPQPQQLQMQAFPQLQAQLPFQAQNFVPRQQFVPPVTKTFQPQQPAPVQQQIYVADPRTIQQSTFLPIQQAHSRPAQVNQQQILTTFNPQNPSRPQYPVSVNQASNRQPFSQQYFTIYPQAPFLNQQQNIHTSILSQKTAPSPTFVSQQQIPAFTQQSNSIGPYSYSFQINHPLKPVF